MYEEAAESYSNAAQVKDDNYWAWYDQGCVYLQELKDYAKAIACFQRAAVTVGRLLGGLPARRGLWIAELRTRYHFL
jgi:tetratricopeptide (TPR) repeat protein